MNFDPVQNAFHEAVDQGVFPGAVTLVAREEEVVFEQAFGFRSLIPDRTPLHLHTVFDLASLTKPLATTLAIMLLTREGKIKIDDRVNRFLPSYGVFGKNLTTIRHLLAHTSGLPGWKPYYEEVIKCETTGKINFVASRGAKNYVNEIIHREKPLHPPGVECLYSDLGFMVLGELVETVTGMPLDRFCLERIFKPLGLASIGFVDLTQIKTRRLEPVTELIAPTEQCPWRRKILCGEFHDDNAYVMGGVAGHAGLFASVRDIHGLLLCLSRCLRGRDTFLPQPLLWDFFTKNRVDENSGFALGWDTPSAKKSASGSFFSPRSIGHLGFTGTSIWWDLEKNCYIILLTNRVHPTRHNEKIRDFRPYIHDLIMRAVFP